MEPALPSFFCPICRDTMHDPVSLETGQSFERAEIEEWLKDHNTCPLTNVVLKSKKLTPNHTLCALIQEYKEKHSKVIRSCLELKEVYAHRYIDIAFVHNIYTFIFSSN